MRTPDLVALDRSIASAADFLLGKQDTQGIFASGCRARPLETALALHLLRLLGEAKDRQIVLSEYCRRRLRRRGGEGACPRRVNQRASHERFFQE